MDTETVIWCDVNAELDGHGPFPWFEWQYPVPGPTPELPMTLSVVSDEYGVSVCLHDPFNTRVGAEMGWKWSDVPGEVIEQRRDERRGV